MFRRLVRTLKQKQLFTPVAFVILSVMAFSFVGDGMRDAADPYSR